MSALSQDSYANAETPITFNGKVTSSRGFSNVSANSISLPITATATNVVLVNTAETVSGGGNQIDLTDLIDAGCSFAEIYIGSLAASTSTASQVEVSFYLSTIPPATGGNTQDPLLVQAFSIWTVTQTINNASATLNFNAVIPVPLHVVASSPTLYVYIISSSTGSNWGYTFSNSYVKGLL